MKRFILLAATHTAVLLLGAALGIYFLPILAAPPAPSASEVQAAAKSSTYQGAFRRDLKGSDALHWGEGRVSIGPDRIALMGRVSPGPAYKLYLVPEYVETHDDFLRVKAKSLAVSDIKTFENFIVPVAPGTKLEDYKAVVVWCEAFSQFITAARYRP